MAIEREIGHQPLQLRVLFAQLPEFPQFTQPQPRVFPFPHIERLLTHPHVSTNLRYGRPALRVSQSGQDLFLGMPTSSCHRWVLLLSHEDHVAGHFLKRPLAYFSGFGSLSSVRKCYSTWYNHGGPVSNSSTTLVYGSAQLLGGLIGHLQRRQEAQYQMDICLVIIYEHTRTFTRSSAAYFCA